MKFKHVTSSRASDSCFCHNGHSQLTTFVSYAKNRTTYVFAPGSWSIYDRGKNPQIGFFATFFFSPCLLFRRSVQLQDAERFTSEKFPLKIRSPACGFTLHISLSLWPHHKFIGAYYVRLLDRFSLWHWPVPERSKASLFLDGFMARMGNGKMILCKAILHIHQMGLFMSYERRRVYLYCLLRGSSLDTWHQLWALKCFAGMIPSIGS